MRTISIAVGFVLGVASLAAAQDGLTQRERDYAARLAGALTPQSEFTVRPVEFTYPTEEVALDGEPPRSAPVVKGLAVEVDGLTVERLRFETPEQAQAIADRMLNGDIGLRPVTGELRGNQLVLIHGQAVKDPERVDAMLRSAWQGLPTPKGTERADASFTQLEDGSVALTTRVPGPLRESIDRALEAAREREAATKANPEQATITTTPTSAHIAFPSGFRAGLQADDDGASIYTVDSKESKATETVMKRHLAALGGHPARGAASFLEGLLGD